MTALIDTAPPLDLPVAAPPGTRIYAIGDIHGKAELLDVLLDWIAADAAATPTARMLLVYLGDYVDRGPDSAGVLDRLAAGPPAGLDQIALKGNHEDLMLRFLAGESEVADDWLWNGGEATFRSYGVATEERDPTVLRRGLSAAMPAAHRRLLEGLPTAFEVGPLAFVHAGLRPGVAFADQSTHDRMWIRRDFLRHEGTFDRYVVHGHTPDRDIRVGPWRLGLDTGAVYGGALTVAAIEADTARIVQAGPTGAARSAVP